MYSITWKGNRVGSARIETKGLYYHISCSCRLPEEGHYDVVLYGEKGELSLGLCVPKGEEFVIEKSVPIKRVPEGQLRFALSKRGADNGIFLPVDPGKAFSYLSKLKHSRLSIKNGVTGIVYNESSSPTGQ